MLSLWHAVQGGQQLGEKDGVCSPHAGSGLVLLQLPPPPFHKMYQTLPSGRPSRSL